MLDHFLSQSFNLEIPRIFLASNVESLCARLSAVLGYFLYERSEFIQFVCGQ